MVCFGAHKHVKTQSGNGMMEDLMAHFSVNKYGNERHALSHDPKHYLVGYSYLGPATEIKLREQLHDDVPLNDLDQFAKEHDYAYMKEKEEYQQDHNKQKHMNNVWKHDDVFINKSKNSRDDPEMGNIASALISYKKNAEQSHTLPTKEFSGFGIKQEDDNVSEKNSDPAYKLRQLVQQKYKKELKQNEQKGGMIPLAAIALPVAGALAGEIVKDI